MTDGMSIQIGIYLLERAEEPYPDEWGKVIVAAATEKAARELANQESGAEGYVWTDGTKTSAKFIGPAAEDVHGILLASRD